MSILEINKFKMNKETFKSIDDLLFLMEGAIMKEFELSLDWASEEFNKSVARLFHSDKITLNSLYVQFRLFVVQTRFNNLMRVAEINNKSFLEEEKRHAH